MSIVISNPASATSSYYRLFDFTDFTSVQGTWTWNADASAHKTHYGDQTALNGWWGNSTHAQNDEVKYPSLYLGAGVYKVTCVVVQSANGDTGKITLGTTDILTFTCNGSGYDVVTSSSFTLTGATTADFRLIQTGAGSGGKQMLIQKLYVEKTG